jgi:hypothetical protein
MTQLTVELFINMTLVYTTMYICLPILIELIDGLGNFAKFIAKVFVTIVINVLLLAVIILWTCVILGFITDVGISCYYDGLCFDLIHIKNLIYANIEKVL